MKQLKTAKEIEKELERVIWQVNKKIVIDKCIWVTGSLELNSKTLYLRDALKESS